MKEYYYRTVFGTMSKFLVCSFWCLIIIGHVCMIVNSTSYRKTVMNDVRPPQQMDGYSENIRIRPRRYRGYKERQGHRRRRKKRQKHDDDQQQQQQQLQQRYLQEDIDIKKEWDDMDDLGGISQSLFQQLFGDATSEQVQQGTGGKGGKGGNVGGEEEGLARSTNSTKESGSRKICKGKGKGGGGGMNATASPTVTMSPSMSPSFTFFSHPAVNNLATPSAFAASESSGGKGGKGGARDNMLPSSSSDDLDCIEPTANNATENNETQCDRIALGFDFDETGWSDFSVLEFRINFLAVLRENFSLEAVSGGLREYFQANAGPLLAGCQDFTTEFNLNSVILGSRITGLVVSVVFQNPIEQEGPLCILQQDVGDSIGDGGDGDDGDGSSGGASDGVSSGASTLDVADSSEIVPHRQEEVHVTIDEEQWASAASCLPTAMDVTVQLLPPERPSPLEDEQEQLVSDLLQIIIANLPVVADGVVAVADPTVVPVDHHDGATTTTAGTGAGAAAAAATAAIQGQDDARNRIGVTAKDMPFGIAGIVATGLALIVFTVVLIGGKNNSSSKWGNCYAKWYTNKFYDEDEDDNHQNRNKTNNDPHNNTFDMDNSSIESSFADEGHYNHNHHRSSSRHDVGDYDILNNPYLIDEKEEDDDDEEETIETYQTLGSLHIDYNTRG